MDIRLPLEVIPSFLGYGILICLLLKPGKSPSLAVLAALALAMLAASWTAELLNGLAVLFLITSTVIASQVHSRHSAARRLAWTVLCLFPFLLAIHLIPGFATTTVFGPALLGDSTIPYTLNANLDKACGALLVLFCFRYYTTISFNPPFTEALTTEILVKTMAAISAVFALGILLGVEADPKFGQLTLAFIFFNLFVTCVAEEAFFRLLIQRFLFKKTAHAYLAIIGSSLIFTLAHLHTGPGMIERLTLIFAAGLLSAWAFQRTRSLLLAILIHFCINIIHLSLFVYPASFS
jgi:CAAX protease family protein